MDKKQWDIIQNWKRCGYITVNNVEQAYIVKLHLFGIRIPCETIKTSNYANALKQVSILQSKYNY